MKVIHNAPVCLASSVSMLSVIALLLASGCGTTETKPVAATPPPGGAVDWKADFQKQKDEAEANVRLARTAFPAGSVELFESQARYQRARNSVNLLIEDIQNSVRENRDPKTSPYYPGRARAAEETLLSYNKYVQQHALPPEKQPKFWQAALPIITGLGGSIWDKITESGTRRQQERKAVLERAAADLETVRFPEFDTIPAT